MLLSLIKYYLYKIFNQKIPVLCERNRVNQTKINLWPYSWQAKANFNAVIKTKNKSIQNSDLVGCIKIRGGSS